MTVTTPNIAGAAQGREGNDARSASYDRWTATPPRAATTTPIGRMNQMGTIQRWWSTRKVSRPARPDVTPGTRLSIDLPFEGAVFMAHSRRAA